MLRWPRDGSTVFVIESIGESAELKCLNERLKKEGEDQAGGEYSGCFNKSQVPFVSHFDWPAQARLPQGDSEEERRRRRRRTVRSKSRKARRGKEAAKAGRGEGGVGVEGGEGRERQRTRRHDQHE